MSDPSKLRVVTFLLLLGTAIVGCADSASMATAPESDALSADALRASAVSGGTEYLVLGNGNKLPRGFEADVTRAGGEVVLSVPQIGAAVVRSTNPDFEAAIGGINGLSSVSGNLALQMVPDRVAAPEATAGVVEPALTDPPATDIGDAFFDLQWSMDAMDWTEAVEISNVRGQGVRVAILDSGIRSSHNEFASNLNTALSTSFVPGEDFDNPPGFHGTHVSGIVAAAQNNIGTIGVAPEAELVSVKVLGAVSGSGSFGGVAAGMVYAADIGADLINMSLGATFDHSGTVYDANCNVVGQAAANQIAALVNLMARAAQYAHHNGVTIIAAGGNCGNDGDKDADRMHLPSDVPHVLSISATAPMGWALDPETNLDRLASFSNHGRSVTDFAAPGGDFALPGNAPCQILAGPADQSIVVPCWVFDMVMSASSSSDFTYSWTAGTSMAAPAATGVAALIIAKNGGSMHPAQVEAAMRKAVNFDDGGDAGNGRTSEFGLGHLSALEALR